MRRVEALDQELLLGIPEGLDGSALPALQQVGRHFICSFSATGVSCVPLSVFAMILRKVFVLATTNIVRKVFVLARVHSLDLSHDFHYLWLNDCKTCHQYCYCDGGFPCKFSSLW